MNLLINLLNKYVNALKNINKKHYFTPIPILLTFIFLWQWYELSTTGFINIVLYPIYSWYFVLAIITYPFSRTWIESTNIFRMIFRNSSFFKQGIYALSKHQDIQSEIEYDYVVKSAHIRGSNKKINYLGVTDRGSRNRAANKTALNIMIFIFKDIFLRYFIYFGTAMISPILFLVAVPELSKKGIIETDTAIGEMSLEDMPKKLLLALILGVFSLLLPVLLELNVVLLISIPLGITGVTLSVISLKNGFHKFRVKLLLAISLNFIAIIVSLYHFNNSLSIT